MLHRLFTGLAFCVIVTGSSAAQAGPNVTLSSPDNLSSITVGQILEIDVTLSGLPVGSDFIFNLNTKVLFPNAEFQAVPDPTSSSGLKAVVAPGSVFDNNVQGPLQVANFNAQSSLVAGAAIGVFSQSPNTNSGAIGLNGLYYSFDVQAISAGSGSIGFDPTGGANEYAADDTGFNFASLPTGPDLSFTIAAAAVPEPSSIAMLAVGVAAIGCWTRIRGRAAA